MASKPINLATADHAELVKFLKSAELTGWDENAETHDLRKLAIRTQDELADIGENAETEKEALAASKQERTLMAEEGKKALQALKGAGLISEDDGATEEIDMDSTEVMPHDGQAASIHSVMSEQAESEDGGNKTAEQLMAEEQARQHKARQRLLAVAAADKQIGVYHRKSMEKFGAKETNVCFYLLSGMQLSTFFTKYTRIPGIRLQKETPYRALDVELPIFRRKRGMFGEKAYDPSAVGAMPRVGSAKQSPAPASSKKGGKGKKK